MSLIACVKIILLLILLLFHGGHATEENNSKIHWTRSAELSFVCEKNPGLSICRGYNLTGVQQNVKGGVPDSILDESKFEDADMLARDIAPEDPFRKSVAIDSDSTGSPFDEIVTRAPTMRPENWMEVPQTSSQQQVDPAWWNIYPSLRPKDASYCSQMYRMFIYTCQAGKPLRIDLLKFCEEYSGFCGVPNTHRFPGPRLGAQQGAQPAGGNVGVGGIFGFGVGAVPGLDVGVGWGVGVGPFPWFNDNIGVGLQTGVGVLGSTSPEKTRRGEESRYDRYSGGNYGLSSYSQYGSG